MKTKAAILTGLLALSAGGALLAQESATPDRTVREAPDAAPHAMGDGMGGMPGRGEEGWGHAGRGEGGLGHGPVGLVGEVPNTAPLIHAIYDTDGDGRITAEEIEAVKAARFAAADADGNGGLSPEELVALDEAIRAEVRAARAAARIERLDDDGDGLLQAAEIEARTPRIAPIFDRLDADGDGGLTVEELEAERRGR